MNRNNIENLSAIIQKYFGDFNLPYLEIVENSEKIKSVFSKLLDKNFIAVTREDVISKITSSEEAVEFPHKLALESSDGSTVHCTVFKVGDEKTRAYLITQSKKDPDSESIKRISLFSEILFEFFTMFDDHENSVEQYKSQIGNIREMQAKLFPKFSNIPGFDIASAYLPSELMTGNFIDSVYLDNNTYMIVACDVSRYGSSSIFVGGVIHTMLRYEAQKKMVPSAMIESVLSKLKKSTPGSHEKLFLSVYLINLESGKTILSSYGPLYAYFYNKKKNGYMNLVHTETGKLLEKRVFYKDLSLKLDSGDFILHYSHGVFSAIPEGGEKNFGETKFNETVFENKDRESMDIIHSTVDSLYDYTNYASLDKDIILISIRKT